MSTNNTSQAWRREQLAAMYPTWPGLTIDRQFDSITKQYPQRACVTGDDGNWTYAEVQSRSLDYASALRALGVTYGDHVSVLFANYASFLPIALAVWRLGAVVVLVNYSLKAKGVGYVIEQSRSKVLITMSQFRDNDYMAMLDELVPDWMTGNLHPYTHLKHIVTFGAARPGILTTDELLINGRSLNQAPISNPANADDVAVIMYTSGTTGRPKGVLKSHDQELRDSYAIALQRAYGTDHSVIFSVPIYHAFGFGIGLLSTFWVGGRAILRPRFQVLDMLQQIEKYRPTDCLLVATMAIAIVEYPQLSSYDLSSLSKCMFSSASAPEWIWPKIKEGLGVSELVTSYGMTEITGSQLMTEPDDDIEKVQHTVGHIIQAGVAGVPAWGQRLARLKIVDPASGLEVAAGESGELYWDTPCATRGYFEMPDATRELYSDDRVWLRSGDVGRMRPDQYVELIGRCKDQYNTGGEVVAPREVEDILNAYPGVSQSYVFGLPDERWGEIGAACVVPEPGVTLTAVELQQWSRERLAKYKWPRRIFFCTEEDLPKTASGKVQKFRLVERALAELAQHSSMKPAPDGLLLSTRGDK